MEIKELMNFEGFEHFSLSSDDYDSEYYDYNREYYYTLEQIGKNINKIRKHYAECEKYKTELKKIEEEIAIFRSNERNLYLLQILENFKEESRKNGISYTDNKNMQFFLQENPILDEYNKLEFAKKGCKKSIEELSHFTDNLFCEYAVLTENKKKYIVDLRYCGVLDVSDLEKEIYDFIIASIKTKYLLEITRDDLPLLMKIKEQMNYEPDLSDMDPIDAREEEYYILEDIPRQIFDEFQKAKGYQKVKKK